MSSCGTVLVTGSNGFVGRPLTAALRRLGRTVHGLDVSDEPPPEGVQHHRDDLGDADRLERLLRDAGVTAIVHGGGISGPMVAPGDPARILRVNVVGSINLAEAARRVGIERFVYLSSAAAYGPTRSNPVREEAAFEPDDLYGASKGAVDLLLAGQRRHHGFPAVSLRLSTVYGPGRRTSCAIAAMIRETLAGRPVRLDWGRGYARPYLHVDDAVSAVCAALTVPLPAQPAYNIAGPEFVATEEVARLVAAAIPGADIVLGVGVPGGGYRRDPLDLTAAARDLGYRPRVGIAEGIAGYVAWMRGGAASYLGPPPS